MNIKGKGERERTQNAYRTEKRAKDSKGSTYNRKQTETGQQKGEEHETVKIQNNKETETGKGLMKWKRHTTQ